MRVVTGGLLTSAQSAARWRRQKKQEGDEFTVVQVLLLACVPHTLLSLFCFFFFPNFPAECRRRRRRRHPWATAVKGAPLPLLCNPSSNFKTGPLILDVPPPPPPPPSPVENRHVVLGACVLHCTQPASSDAAQCCLRQLRSDGELGLLLLARMLTLARADCCVLCQRFWRRYDVFAVVADG